MAGYTKEFLIGAFVHRYEPLGLDAVEKLYALANAFYPTVSKEEFRRYCSLDANALQQYKQSTGLVA